MCIENLHFGESLRDISQPDVNVLNIPFHGFARDSRIDMPADSWKELWYFVQHYVQDIESQAEEDPVC